MGCRVIFWIVVILGVVIVGRGGRVLIFWVVVFLGVEFIRNNIFIVVIVIFRCILFIIVDVIIFCVVEVIFCLIVCG